MNDRSAKVSRRYPRPGVTGGDTLIGIGSTPPPNLGAIQSMPASLAHLFTAVLPTPSAGPTSFAETPRTRSPYTADRVSHGIFLVTTHTLHYGCCARNLKPHPGFPRVTPHDLRHTAASLAISVGANVKAIQRMLGHSSAAMTIDVYADLFEDDLDAVAVGLNAVAFDLHL